MLCPCAHRESFHRFEPFSRHRLRRTPQSFPLRPSALEARNGCALSTARARTDSGPRELRVGVVRWRSRGPSLPSATRMGCSATGDSRARPGGALRSRPIRSSAQHAPHVDFRSPGVEEQSIQARPAILCPAHLVGVFSIDNPAPRVAVATELEELVLAGLGSVGSADASVDRGLHGNTAASFQGALPLSFGMILTVILFLPARYTRIRGGSTRSVPGRRVR